MSSTALRSSIPFPVSLASTKASAATAACAQCAFSSSDSAPQWSTSASTASYPAPSPILGQAASAYTASEPGASERSRRRRHSTRAARRTVGGGTRGAQATSAAHSSLYPDRQAAACASREAYRATLEMEHRSKDPPPASPAVAKVWSHRTLRAASSSTAA